MGTLIKVTSIPFESIRFTQNARLVPSDRVAAERQKALSLHRAYQHQYRGRGSYSGFDFISQVRQAFPSGTLRPSRHRVPDYPRGYPLSRLLIKKTAWVPAQRLHPAILLPQ